MAFAALLLASLGTSGTPEARAQPPLKVDVTSPVCPLAPGATFDVNIGVENVFALHAYQIKLSWNQKILQVSEADVSEGPFLGSGGKGTYFVFALGVAGESVTMADLIKTYDWVDGSGILAHVHFKVIGGGETNLTLEEVRLEDADGNPLFPDAIVANGYFWSDYPYIDFTYFVPTAVETPPQANVSVTGQKYYTVTDPDGDIDFVEGDYYPFNRTTLDLDDNTGAPEGIKNVTGATMFYGDKIFFDASGSYDMDAPHHRIQLSPDAFNWTIRAAGEDVYKTKSKTTGWYYYDPVEKKYWYDFKYQSGAELPFAKVFGYTFPGDLPWVYKLYSLFLGWHDLKIVVTDSDNNTAEYYTWIRIFRLTPARTVMINIPGSTHSLSKNGNTMKMGGKVQNMGGTGWFPWESLTAYLELARMVHAYMWIRIQFDIFKGKDQVGTVYSDAIWLYATETLDSPMYATWNIPGTGTYLVKAKGYFCGSGVTYGLGATGTASQLIKIVA